MNNETTLLNQMLSEIDCYEREGEAHQNADDLLVQAIQMLAEQCGKETWAKAFLEAYEKIEKWYE